MCYVYFVCLYFTFIFGIILMVSMSPEDYSRYEYPITPECEGGVRGCERGCFKYGENENCIDKYICIDNDTWGCLSTCPESRYNNETDVCGNPEYDQAKKEYDEYHNAHVNEIIISMIFIIPLFVHCYVHCYVLECVNQQPKELESQEESVVDAEVVGESVVDAEVAVGIVVDK